MNRVKEFYLKHEQEISIVLFILLLCSFLLAVLSPGYDYWWHLKTGNYILSTHTIPKTALFSWYGLSNNLPWISHEWLSEVIIASFKSLFGSYGIITYCLFWLGLTFLLLYWFLKKNILNNFPFTLGYFFLGVFILGMGLIPRPHLISNFLFLLTLWLLFDFYHNEKSKKIYFMPVIALLWANIHGGSSNLPYILCFTFTLLGLFTFQISKIETKKMSVKQLRTYFLIGLFCLLVIPLNPHGLTMVGYPYTNFFDSFMQNIIIEWQAPKLLTMEGFPILILLLLVVGFIIFTKKKIPFIPLVLVLLFGGLSLKSMRFVPYFYFTAGYMLFQLVPSCKVSLVAYRLVGGLSLLFLIAFLPRNLTAAYQKTNTSLIPDSVINILKEEQPKRLFNYYDYGGYLIYQDIPVFIDGRADIYSNYNLRDFNQIIWLNDGFEETISNYDFDYYLIPSHLPLVTYLEESNYLLLYQDTETKINLYKKL